MGCDATGSRSRLTLVASKWFDFVARILGLGFGPYRTDSLRLGLPPHMQNERAANPKWSTAMLSAIAMQLNEGLERNSA